MPYGLPSATVTETSGNCWTEARDKQVRIPYQAHVFPQYPAADQDGWTGEIISKFNGENIAIPRSMIRL